MASTIRQRLRRYNGTDYDTVHLENHANNVLVDIGEEFVNPLNTDQLMLGQHGVYFKAYPSLIWCVDHLDGNYAYLGLYNVSEKTAFGSNNRYSGSTAATKCTTFLNSTIPNVASYLESVTVNGVTNKVFIPSYKMFSGNAAYGGGDANDPTFSWTSESQANRAACADWSIIGNYFQLSSPFNSSNDAIWIVYNNGGMTVGNSTYTYGFRPEVKVKYKLSQDTLDRVLDDMNNRITYGTTDLTPGSSALTTGNVYLVYE